MKRQHFDEFYSNGKIELGRIGNLVSVKNNFTEEETNARNKLIATHFDEEKTEIQELIEEITTKISKCEPVSLLMAATDLTMASMINIFTETEDDQREISVTRYIEYIQSILVSKNISISFADEEDQQALFMEIFSDIETLYMRCQFFYLIWAAKAEETNEFERKEIEYIVESQLMNNVRGHRYQFQQLDDLERLISPHSQKILEVYGETSQSLIMGLRKMEKSLSSGKLDSFKAFFDDYEDFQKKAEGKNGEELTDLMEEKSQDSKTQEFIAKCFGTDLYEVKKITNWDDRLIDKLSWSIGENTDFFSKSEYPGWPIQNLPVQRRPFIKIDGKAYCFDYYNLFDNIYRILQKNIREQDPAYSDKWSKIQQEASESLVAEKFESLLPNATVYIGNYYPTAGSLKQMDENDIFVICDDVIIIAEVKAGSFTYTPALTDFNAHKKSFDSLIGKADYQCERTLKYLKSESGKRIFYNNDKSIKFEIDNKSIRRIFTMCVTVDNFNEFEAKIEKTNFFDTCNGTIAISIDDLDVYEDYFSSEIEFLHFLKHRKASTRINALTLSDELDHLGLYIDQNIYEEYANDFRDCNSFVAEGFREELDAYYAGVHNNKIAIKKPQQPIPNYYEKIFAFLEKDKVKGRIEFGEFLLDFAYDERKRFDESISGRISREKQLGYITPIWVEGNQFSYCCFVGVHNIDVFSERYRKLYTYSNMLDRKQDTCWYIYLDIDDKCQIKDLKFQKLLFSQHEDEGYGRSELSMFMQNIKERRKAAGVKMPAVHKKKIYPNDLCTCGSGLKYKKCCGRKA